MLNTYTDKHKHKFIEGKDYWTFFMRMNNKGSNLINVVKVFKTTLLKKEETEYGLYLQFSITNAKNLSDTMKHNLPIYMNGYGMAQCEYYDSEEEAKIGFDNMIKNMVSDCESVTIRDNMYKKMYYYSEPKISNIEKKSKDWKSTLSKEQLSYLDWFIQNK